MKKNIDFFEDFYRQYGAPMIHEHFPEYEGRIAVGVVGEGSDAFGFDDEISRDHHFGLGFCMWLHAADYAKIGEKLENIYRNLLAGKGEAFARSVWGEKAAQFHPRYDSVRGVSTITDFYCDVLQIPKADEEELLIGNGVYDAEECYLATAVNGRVFRDDERTFSLIRERLLKHYPEGLRRKKIARALQCFSQGGQMDYQRSMVRKDYVAARLAQGQAARCAMHLAYLLNRTYMPYEKWQRRGLSDLLILSEMGPILDALSLLNVQDKAWANKAYDPVEVNYEDNAVVLIEKLAQLILAQLKAQGLIQANGTGGRELSALDKNFVPTRDTFLKAYVKEVADSAATR